MPVSYAASIKSARMQAVLAGIDANASPAYIEICSAAYAAVLATITLSKPSFSEANGVLTMLDAPKSGQAAATDVAVIARIKDGAGVIKASNLTVGVNNAEINLASTSLQAGQTVTITSGTITHSA